MFSQLTVKIITPDMAEYEILRQPWNLSVNQRPAGIVLAQTAEDVALAVQYARSQGLKVAVQGSGHGVARPADGALLIVTSPLQTVRIDAEKQTAYVEAGVKWGKVLEQAQQVGLAPLLGSSPDVGVVGYTLGGGLGWLARQYGLAVDSVRAFEVVTAEGNMLRVTPDQNADLFWGLCGGGGSLAIVTAIEMALYPVTTVFAGNLFYPIQQAQAVMQRYREWIKTAPDELTTSVVLMNFPPMPELPDFLRGQSYVIIRGCYAGATETGRDLLRYWLEWQTPAVNLWNEIPFSAAATISSDPVDPLPGIASGGWLADLSDDTIEILTAHALPSNGSPLVFIEVRHAGGAIKRVHSQANAYGHRDSELVMSIIGVTPTPDIHAMVRDYIASLKQTLGEHLTQKVYLNFLEGAELRARTADGYLADSYHRLQALKARFDPTDVFSHSFNI